MQGILIDTKPDFDEVTIVELDESRKLDGMYGYLECRMVDCVNLDTNLDMWLDDEALLVAQPQINRVATALAIAMGVATQDYYGKVLLLGRKGSDTVGLSDAVRDELITDLSNIREAIGG